jgi:hypothetical protein
MGNPNWKKGVSGNPGGRSKDHWELTHACRKIGPDLIENLRELAFNSRDERVRVLASKELLDRGFGKPVQTVAAQIAKTQNYVIFAPPVIADPSEWQKVHGAPCLIGEAGETTVEGDGGNVPPAEPPKTPEDAA